MRSRLKVIVNVDYSHVKKKYLTAKKYPCGLLDNHFTKRTLRKWFVSGLDQEMFKTSLEHLVMPDNKQSDTTKDIAKGCSSQTA